MISIHSQKLSKDQSGRRIMFRAYYPACNRTDFVATNNTCAGTIELGRRRKYFEEGEWEAYSMFGDVQATNLTSLITTYSYLNAPMAVDLGARPVIIYTHGATTWVSENTALVEELASHGYAVFCLALPGFASGVLYPNGDVVALDDDFVAALSGPYSSVIPQSSDINTRYQDINGSWMLQMVLRPSRRATEMICWHGQSSRGAVQFQ